MGELVDSPATVDGTLAAAAELLASASGISWAYDLLTEVAARNSLTGAWLVLHPGTDPDPAPSAGPQLFALGGRPVPVSTAAALLRRPPGVYGEPHELDTTTRQGLAAMCAMCFRGSVTSLRAAVDPLSGLSSRTAIRAAVVRATACAARYGWSSTLVRLTTGGDSPGGDRWRALAAALRHALRSGDEAGVTSPGIALAILGNAGPDAVRPFIARVRAALSAAGRDDIDLHASTASSPSETVDPAELERLTAERLSDAGVATPVASDPATTLELELRLVPGVVSVAMATPIVVLSASAPDPSHEEVHRVARSRLPGASVSILSLADEPAAAQGGPARPAPSAGGGGTTEPEHVNGNGNRRVEDATPHAISATAPGGGATTELGGGARVSFLQASFDPERGTSEVSLSLGATRGTGRAPAGPLAGGAQATLNALRALSIDIPFYLVSAERAHGVPGEPVVVVLAPRRGPGVETNRTVERLGVATGNEDVEAASRATLGALNRHLARGPVAP
ncbi:MAG TPA: hypothetical protein VND62_09110 [Acidimicrobiales bacterium]|nr:hypothetical protein [Acidimicrobiales bacterium]